MTLTLHTSPVVFGRDCSPELFLITAYGSPLPEGLCRPADA